MKSITRNQFLFSKNVLKLTYGNVELKTFFGGITPEPPLQGGRRGLRGVQGKGYRLKPPSHKFLATSLLIIIIIIIAPLTIVKEDQWEI